MAKSKAPSIPAAKLALYDKLIASNAKHERKGVGLPYTSQNGNMFTFLSSEGSLALRLPETDREDFIKKYKTKLFEAHGAIMKEYVKVPDELLKNTKVLKHYLDLSYEYVKTLKPKPGKKK